MRNLKKFLALVLAMLMVLSVAVISTGAAEKGDYTEAAQHLAALQVMKGNEKGDLMLENGVTRYQAALFFVQALTGETDVATWNADKQSAYFTDVPEYGTAIDHAYGIGLILGRGNGVYGYNDPIIYQDMLVMAVRALGYETDDMSYPYGYILAAQKLELTENVAQVNYKAALTRGETAQIIWDMLGTEVAAVDPLTDKVLYPGETGLTDAILSANGTELEERVTLLEDSGLAGGKIEATIVAFEEADEDDEESFDTVELDNGLVLAAADLGIDAETRKVNYLGLPVELYISVDEEDFEQGAYDDGDAEIVFASFPEYTAVVNLGDAGDIKYVVNSSNAAKSYFSFGGTKFTDEKYTVAVYTFGEDGWEINTDVDLAEIFEYETKDGYVAESGNTYGQVAYRVVDIKDNEDTEDEDEGKIDLVEVLYTPFSFGQYNVREVNGTEYTVVGAYNATAEENMDEVESNFVEYLVDKIGTASAKVTSSTKSISNSKGEAASTVVVEGEAVEAGDFMFYVYNSVDNVLTVAANAGTFQTGRLTAQNTSKETVKIGGTNMEVGFKGLFVATWASAEFDTTANKDYIAALEAGKDNVQYIVVDGNVVYMQACDETSNGSTYDFAIVTLDQEIMMDLLAITSETKYEAALTEGLYVEDGVVKVAMMNKTTGEWELASVGTYAADWDAEDEEFVNEYDIASDVNYTDLIGADYKNAEAVADFVALVDGALVAVIDEADGVYTIADNEADFFVYGTADENGISFSDNSTKTNAITADDEIDAARVTLDAESVIIVVSATGAAGSRVGVQAADNSYPVAAGYFLAASSDLIVLVETETDGMDVAEWADAATANSDENWYITTLTTGVEIETNEDDEDTFIVTITDVYDMKAMEVIESVQTVADKTDSIIDISGAGYVLFKNAQDEIVIDESDFEEIMVEVANDNEDKLEYTALGSGLETFKFVDDDTIAIDGVVTVVEPVEVNATVVTLNMTGLDPEDYDFAAVVSSKEWNDETDTGNDYNVGDVEITVDDPDTEEVETSLVWEYLLDEELVNVVTEPTEGVLDQYIIDEANAGASILVPEVDNDDYAAALGVAVELYVVYSVEDGVANIVVYKVLVPDVQ